jgi:glutathione synthase
MINKKLAIQLDPLDGLKYKSDSTIMLALAAQELGFQCYCYQPENLFYKSGKVYFAGSLVNFAEQEDFYEIAESDIYEASEFDVFLMRQDPPFNHNYLTLTYLLDIVAQKSLVINNPSGVRNVSEKLSTLYFSDYIPPSLISKRFVDLVEFLHTEKQAVLKPIYGFGGHDIKLITHDSADLEETFNYYQQKYDEPIIIQKYLPQITTEGDKRVVFLDGKVVAIIGRIPREGEIRANLAQGGLATKATITKREQEICEQVSKMLIKNDIMLAGIDLIAEYLIEINVTCPTGLRAVQNLYNLNIANEFWQQAFKKYHIN